MPPMPPPGQNPSYGNEKGAIGGGGPGVAPYFNPNAYEPTDKSPSAPANFPETHPHHPNYDPPNYHSMFPDNQNPNASGGGGGAQPTPKPPATNQPPPPAPRKSKMPNNLDDFELPDLPNVPDSLPDLDKDDKGDPPNDDNIDFDDLAARFEALKKKK